MYCCFSAFFLDVTSHTWKKRQGCIWNSIVNNIIHMYHKSSRVCLPVCLSIVNFLENSYAKLNGTNTMYSGYSWTSRRHKRWDVWKLVVGMWILGKVLALCKFTFRRKHVSTHLFQLFTHSGHQSPFLIIKMAVFTTKTDKKHQIIEQISSLPLRTCKEETTLPFSTRLGHWVNVLFTNPRQSLRMQEWTYFPALT